MDSHLNAHLWTIIFDNQTPELDWFQRAHYQESPKKIAALDQRMAIDFLEKINLSFRKMSESYLQEVEQDEKMRPQVNEIRKKFDSLDKWLAWMRSQLDSPKQESF